MAATALPTKTTLLTCNVGDFRQIAPLKWQEIEPLQAGIYDSSLQSPRAAVYWRWEEWVA